MYDSTNIQELSDNISSGANLNSHLGGAASLLDEEEESGCSTANASGKGSHVPAIVRASGEYTNSLEERASRVEAAPHASTRRTRLHRQHEVSEPGYVGAASVRGVSQKLSIEGPEKGSHSPAMRKKYLKDLFVNNGLHSGLGSILLSSRNSSASSKDCDHDAPYCAEESSNSNTCWALDPMEHAWMLLVVDGNFDTIVDYLSEDFSLLTKKDFVSGFTAIHWLAKYGKGETLIKLLKYAENEGFPVNVNLKASGGLTPLHVAAMHGQYMVVKILVGAFGANVDAMDYNGKRAWQYLKSNAPAEMKDLLGGMDDEYGTVGYHNANNSGSAAQSSKCDAQKGEDEVDSFTRRNERSRFGSFRKLFAPLLHFASRSTGNSVDTNY
ncbi:ankyrin repeat domain-containing protein SOWAHC [Megalops cyprinoides]|uniref:ankyrin repeat domain-containing protein SOWAHC n=1 Tax=Megalops cyprinoides TaxID=118141 RepID=UPI001863AE44|nr:ankyrin repeat domain-containing protein SOWAHC [Megalops cyprinoides]